MKFKTDFLMETVWEENEETEKIEDEIVEHTRWSVVHEMVFKYKDKFYQVCYDRPATEYQDGQDMFPWSDTNGEVEAVEVKKVEVVKHEWKQV